MTRHAGARHRLLVVGVGSIGERHARCFAKTGRVDVGVCEIDRALAQRVAADCDIEEVFFDIEDAASRSFDAAVIATPAHLHIEQATLLAEHGVHLLIEKPLSTRRDGIERLRALRDQRRLVVAIGYVWRANPALARLRNAITARRLGEPLQVVVNSGQHFPTYRPAYRDTYYREHGTGGGAIQDAMTHLVNVVEWIVGPTTRITVDAGRLRLEGVKVEDTVHAFARNDHVMVSYSLNQHQAPNEAGITVVCEQGTCRFETPPGRWSIQSVPGEGWKIEHEQTVEPDDPFVWQAERFLDAIESRCDPLCSLEEGMQTLNVNLAALRSASRGGERCEIPSIPIGARED